MLIPMNLPSDGPRNKEFVGVSLLVWQLDFEVWVEIVWL